MNNLIIWSTNGNSGLSSLHCLEEPNVYTAYSTETCYSPAFLSSRNKTSKATFRHYLRRRCSRASTCTSYSQISFHITFCMSSSPTTKLSSKKSTVSTIFWKSWISSSTQRKESLLITSRRIFSILSCMSFRRWFTFGKLSIRSWSWGRIRGLVTKVRRYRPKGMRFLVIWNNRPRLLITGKRQWPLRKWSIKLWGTWISWPKRKDNLKSLRLYRTFVKH